MKLPQLVKEGIRFTIKRRPGHGIRIPCASHLRKWKYHTRLTVANNTSRRLSGLQRYPAASCLWSHLRTFSGFDWWYNKRNTLIHFVYENFNTLDSTHMYLSKLSSGNQLNYTWVSDVQRTWDAMNDIPKAPPRCPIASPARGWNSDRSTSKACRYFGGQAVNRFPRSPCMLWALCECSH